MDFNDERMKKFLQQAKKTHIDRIVGRDEIKAATFMITPETIARLNKYCKERGFKKQNIVESALNFYLEYRAYEEAGGARKINSSTK